MGEPLGRSPRQVAIADHLWEAFDLMSRDMGVDREGLVNQALFAFARQNGYLAPRPSGEPNSLAPREERSGPISLDPGPSSFARVAPIPAPAPNPFGGAPPSAAPRVAPIPVPPAPAPAAPVAAIPVPSIPLASPIPAPAMFDSLSELKLDLPSHPASQPPLLSAPSAFDSRPAPDFGSALAENDGAPPTSESAAASEAVLVLYAEGRELDRVLGQRFLIGRGKHCDLIINSGKVSREHAVILREGSDFYIEDLGSSNGTWFDKKRITRRQIGDGDEYFVCSEKITCHLS